MTNRLNHVIIIALGLGRRVLTAERGEAMDWVLDVLKAIPAVYGLAKLVVEVVEKLMKKRRPDRKG